MGAVIQKLNSKRGASIILAVIFFLICAVIGGVVLASAASNAGRLSHMRDEQQAYLTVSSAARLVRDELKNLSFTGEKHGSVPPCSGPADEFRSNTTLGSLSTLVFEKAEAIYKSSPGINNPVTFSITSDNPELEDVEVTLSVADTGSDIYAVTVTLSLSGGGYPMELYIPVTYSQSTNTHNIQVIGVDEEGNETIEIVSCEKTMTSIVYGEGRITKGGA